MQKIIPHAQLELSQSGMLNNYRYFRSKLNNQTKLLVLVKANSYGHGAVEFAHSLEKAGADYLGVAFPIEGIELKKGGIKLPILVLTSGVESYPEIIEYGLEPGMPNIESLIRLRDELRKVGKTSYPVHIKLDTGMHRLGFMEHELPALKTFLQESPEIFVKSIYSHLAASDDPQHDDFTLGQIALYEKMSSDLMTILREKPIRHILNSAGIERFTQYQYDMVRLGIGIYGISAVNQSVMKPSAYFRCPILQIKELGPDDGTVGYGRHGKLGPGIKRIATICVGYADGINRHLGRGNASFEVNGQLAPTIGNICMDMCMLDITGIDAKVGDTVTIFGDKPTATDLAGILDTIPYEIFTSIPKRVKRVIVD
ncbi:MAG: alanine racemase [Bacteroidales bacterium]|nr:alanine racemase [Bacteroidales bacterium]MDD4670531.1 alanine racemase [Bacteroidales bacterium]